MGDLLILKRTAFKGKCKILDHWEKTGYCLEGKSFAGLLVFRITPVAGEGKVKIIHQNLFGGNIEENFENEGS